jgi:hypothetical protein
MKLGMIVYNDELQIKFKINIWPSYGPLDLEFS